ncbi:MAG: RdgB/HAM1 family non-canonical purine NTP pyrophosphatase [Chromatiales bacterium]|nr:MAG: RdgB/HAM1 family non-canonical purine NTP pyrophosphatase [Chromatiales bacterium]
MRVVLATGNEGKRRELEALLGGDWELVAQSTLGVEPVEETGSTFRDNALLKARHASAATGLPAIADDSGLEVDALDGAPGVYSARYAGADADDAANNAKLLAALADLPADRRGARFRCVMVFVRGPDDPEPLIADCSWEGRIATAARGAGGFGYDPLFVDPESGRHSAQLTADEKNARSHRGQAARQLRDQLLGRHGSG